MTRHLFPLLFAPALLAAAAWAPAPAAAQSEGRAVAQCRTEALRQFPEDTVRSYRIASIEGSARRTRVNIFVTTDRRYSFECTANAQGQVVTASWNPPVGERLAGQPR